MLVNNLVTVKILDVRRIDILFTCWWEEKSHQLKVSLRFFKVLPVDIKKGVSWDPVEAVKH